VTFAGGRVRTVRTPGDRHPWLVPATVMPFRVARFDGGREVRRRALQRRRD